MKGTLFDIQRFSVDDGPGIRTTVFMKGCPLRCAWCQNPEGISFERGLWKFDNLCTGCEACARICPAETSSHACTLCGACVEECPNNARAFVGFELEDGELAERLLADRVFFDSSGGGVTFSGGEPLAQHEFVIATANRLREQGVHTAVETSMACAWDALEAAMNAIDRFIVDLKLADPDRHRAATGTDNRTIQENFTRIHKHIGNEDRLTIRIPLIPGFTDDAENLAAVGRFIASHGSSVPVELMNFNPLAGAKYKRMHLDDALWKNAVLFTPGEMAAKNALVQKTLSGE